VIFVKRKVLSAILIDNGLIHKSNFIPLSKLMEVV
jgi:hypothetical protein